MLLLLIITFDLAQSDHIKRLLLYFQVQNSNGGHGGGC